MTHGDKVFPITGASTGIGAATARHAAQEGYRLVLAGLARSRVAARAVMFAVAQPPHVDVNEILIRPTAQSG